MGSSCPCAPSTWGLAGYVLELLGVRVYLRCAARHLYGRRAARGENRRATRSAQAAAARILVGPLTRALEDEGSERAYFDIDLPLVAVLAIMERTGAAHRRRTSRRSWADVHGPRQSRACATQIFELAGQEFNVDSPKQLGHILFEVLGSARAQEDPARLFHRRKSAQRACTRSTSCRPWCLRYRELAKIKSTYLDALPRDASRATARVHTTLQRDGHHHWAACPHRIPTCRTSPCAPISAAMMRDVLRAARARASVFLSARLLADRAAPACAPVGRRAPRSRRSARAPTSTPARPRRVFGVPVDRGHARSCAAAPRR